MSNSLDRICTVDISLASPISNDANFDNILRLVGIGHDTLFSRTSCRSSRNRIARDGICFLS